MTVPKILEYKNTNIIQNTVHVILCYSCFTVIRAILTQLYIYFSEKIINPCINK